MLATSFNIINNLISSYEIYIYVFVDDLNYRLQE